MRTKVSLLFLALLLIAADKKEDGVKKEQEKLQGTWVVVSAEQDGKPLDRIKGGKLTVTDNGFVIKTASGAELKGTLTLDPEKKPKAMDLHHDEGVLRDKTWKGIYHLDGDDLKICYAEADSGKDRPNEFATAEGSGFLMTIMKREKP